MASLGGSLGNVIAQNDLGWKYYNGNSVLKESAEALKWFREAAGQGLEQRALTAPDYQFDPYARGDPPGHGGPYTGFSPVNPRALTDSCYRFYIFRTRPLALRSSFR